MANSKVARRTFLRNSLAATVAVPLAGIPIALRAQDNQLAEDNPQAQALGYKHDTSTVDGGKFPNHSTDQKCSNCMLYQGQGEEGWGGCGIFPGKQVNAKGWCSAWVKKAG